jgi:1,6-anhydro-N-acetylmuramate kinase
VKPISWEIGLSILTVNLTGKATLKEKISEFLKAYDFGKTSAKITKISVITIAAKATPPSPNKVIAVPVARAEARTLTALLPISRVLIRRSRFDLKSLTIEALLSPFLDNWCILASDAAVKAVSELEKKAEIKIKIKIAIIKSQNSMSVMFLILH